jgi:hypothetical protein
LTLCKNCGSDGLLFDKTVKGKAAIQSVLVARLPSREFVDVLEGGQVQVD